MAWIELHQTRQRHPKTLRLAAALDVSRREACGLLDDLWTWALDIATPDGTIPGLTCEDVAIALDYPRKRGEWLMDALIRSGYVDRLPDDSYMLHDWPDYAGRLNDKRKDTKARVERYRERKKQESVTHCNALPSVTKTKSNASTVPLDGSGSSNTPITPSLSQATVSREATVGDTTPREPNAFVDGPPEITVEAYIANELPRMSPGNIDQLRSLQDDGMQDDAIKMAVDIAAARNSRTWGFVCGILRKWAEVGVWTAGDARAAEDAFRAQKARAAPGRPSQPALSKAEQFMELARRYESEQS